MEQNNPPVAPPMQQQAPAESQKTNTLAIVGFIFAFLLPLVGLIVSIVSLNQIKKRHEQGHGLAIAGIIISAIFMLITLLILPALVITSFSGVQTKARDSERQTDINALSSFVESYYTTNQKYPTLENMNDAAWRTTNLAGFDEGMLKAPEGTQSTLSAEPSEDSYAYAPTGADGQPCDNAAVPCTKYTLTTSLEAGGTYHKQNYSY